MKITAEQLLEEKGCEILTVSPETRVIEAIRLMVTRRVGAVVVKEARDLVGIWTERDLLHDMSLEGFDPHTARIGDYMTSPLHAAPYDAPLAKLADQFVGRRIRHLLIEREGRFIGLLSSGDVLKAQLQEQAHQVEELNDLVQLEFYEQWRWKNKRNS